MLLRVWLIESLVEVVEFVDFSGFTSKDPNKCDQLAVPAHQDFTSSTGASSETQDRHPQIAPRDQPTYLPPNRREGEEPYTTSSRLLPPKESQDQSAGGGNEALHTAESKEKNEGKSGQNQGQLNRIQNPNRGRGSGPGGRGGQSNRGNHSNQQNDYDMRIYLSIQTANHAIYRPTETTFLRKESIQIDFIIQTQQMPAAYVRRLVIQSASHSAPDVSQSPSTHCPIRESRCANLPSSLPPSLSWKL